MKKTLGAAVALAAAVLLPGTGHAGSAAAPPSEAIRRSIAAGLAVLSEGPAPIARQTAERLLGRIEKRGLPGPSPAATGPRKECRGWDSIRDCVPREYRPYAVIVMLKNMTRPVPDGSGGYRHERIYVPLLAAHPHVALRGREGFHYADDAVDKDGNLYRLDRIYLNEGLKSWVSKTAMTNAAPSKLLGPHEREILKGTLQDIAVKCGVKEEAAQEMDLDTLRGVVDPSCAAQFTP